MRPAFTMRGMPKGSAHDPKVRFWFFTKLESNGCWLWTGATIPKGYGSFTIRRKRVYAHRFAYETFVGPILDGMVIDHLCRNPSCVNPAHLEAVTNSENLLRGVGPTVSRARHAARTHCKRGHPFSLSKQHRSDGRRCRICAATLLKARKLAMGINGHRRGDRVHNAKLTVADVLRVRQLPYEQTTPLARELGVDRSTIKKIRRREMWTHV